MQAAVAAVFVCLFLSATGVAAPLQDGDGGVVVQNPLVEIRAALERVLQEAGTPITPEQVQAIALVMDEQRRATETLFGDIFNFTAGPPQGAALDKAMAGIAWMTEAFLGNVGKVLTPAQTDAWMKARRTDAVPAGARLVQETPAAGGGSSRQIAQIRINNNPFTAESIGTGSGTGSNEVITRGGVGDFHGNVAFTFQKHQLNARNPFASNKPPYMQRDLQMGFNGPVIRNRMTVSVSSVVNLEEAVDTISAITPAGLVEEGITRPARTRSVTADSQLQLSERQALHFTGDYGVTPKDNQGIGGITLRERGTRSDAVSASLGGRSLTTFATSIVDVRLRYDYDTSEVSGFSRNVAVDVTDAFNGGGATTRNEARTGETVLQSQYLRYGNRLTVKAGFETAYKRDRTLNQDNFNGTFQFSSLDDFIAVKPATYTVSTGDPALLLTQWETAAYVQNDVRVSSRLNLMLGLRYQVQTNIDDRNNLAPRLGVAYALNDATVLRGGVGRFHDWLLSGNVRQLMRLDGTRQQQLVVTTPSYPDPFRFGAATLRPPSSIRFRSPDLENATTTRAQAAIERQLPGNLLTTVAYEFNRSDSLYRSVNLNAPRPGETVRPDPTRGNLLELQSTGGSWHHRLQVDFRQRLRTFTVSGMYRINRQRNNSDGAFSLPSNNYDLDLDWGRGTLRERLFNVAVNAQAPLGVFMTVVYTSNAGQPYTITTGRDDNFDTVLNDRPAGVERNSETGPGLQTVDVNLSKVFYLRRDVSAGARRAGGAGMQVNVFANVTNALNRTNFATVSGALTSRRFGQPTSASAPREIEIGARFQF